MEDILIVLACMGLGMCCGHWRRNHTDFLRIADKSALCAVYGLLFVLGFRLGANAQLFAQLPILGGKALGITLCCTAGSILCIFLARGFFALGPVSADPPAASASAPSPLWGSLRILCFFSLGLALGYLSLGPAWLNNSLLASYAFFFLVFAVGVGLGADLRVFGIARDLHMKILAVPGLILIGTAAGATAASLMLPGTSLRDALCVGAGLGYYSLSSLLIEKAGDSSLASVTLLANIMREIIAIVSAPLLSRWCGKLASVAAAGSTAMDTALPVIARFSGERAAVIAVFSGMCLTLLVPFLVTLALAL